MSRLIICGILGLSLLAPLDARADGVADADGETPVRYVICGSGENNCFVSARFRDFDGCERHKEWSALHCDWVSDPGAVACKRSPLEKQWVKAYCTR